MSLLAIDMGSSSCKAVAFAVDGAILGQQTYSYSPETPRPNWAEMPAEKYWEALCSVSRALGDATSRDPVEALSISSHGETFVPVDRLNRPLSPAILNMDNRAVDEADQIAATIDARQIFEITGLSLHPTFPIPKILWLRKHRPDIFAKATRFLSVTDFLLARMGLRAYVDYSLASRFLAFDVTERRWSDKLLSKFDLAPDMFATPVQAGTIAGEISTATAKELGLPAGAQVIVGGHDQACAALGLGVIDRGRVSASLGTYECVLAASDKPALNDEAFAARLNTYCHVVPERYVTLGYFPAGIMVEWLLQLLRTNENAVADADPFSDFEREASLEPSGLLITPHLLGTGTPDFDPLASGVIFGLRPSTRGRDLYRGILEGIACEFANTADLLEIASGPFSDVFVTGGGCRSRLGLEMRATLSNRSLHRMKCAEAVCLGAAILAGVGAGKYTNISEAVSQLVKVSDTVEPRKDMAALLPGQRKKYQALCATLKEMRTAQAARA